VARLEIDEYANALDDAKSKLTAFQRDHSQIEEAILALESRWWFVPTAAQERLEETKAGLSALPDASAKEKAIEFLAVVQDRYEVPVEPHTLPLCISPPLARRGPQ
jgi:hypothetical protein